MVPLFAKGEASLKSSRCRQQTLFRRVLRQFRTNRDWHRYFLFSLPWESTGGFFWNLRGANPVGFSHSGFRFPVEIRLPYQSRPIRIVHFPAKLAPKGLGHPDSICDAVMEQVSIALCRAYLEQFGRILHHNCDKALLAAHSVERLGSGARVIGSMKLIVGDRAASQLKRERQSALPPAPSGEGWIAVVKRWWRYRAIRMEILVLCRWGEHTSSRISKLSGAGLVSSSFRDTA